MSEKSYSSDDDDDDDDEPLISSPDSTSDKNGVQNDVFHYTARKFQKVNESVGPSPALRRRHHVDTCTVQTKLSMLEHQQHVRDRKLRKRLHVDHDDSSDEDIDKAASATAQGGKRYTASHAPPPPAVNPITIDISDDSDDEAKPSGVSLSALKQAPREVLEVLQKSQQATYRLRLAQLYHAEDVEVQVQSLPNHIHNNTNINLNGPLRPKRQHPDMRLEPSVTSSIKPTLGKKIQLTCRCQLKINGNNQPTLEKNVTVHENEHLAQLMDKVCIAFSLPPTARVTLNFDGLVLDTKRTPASYEMEDGDLVDINASVIAMPTTNATKASSGLGLSTGPKINLTLRSKVNTKVHETSLQMGKNQVFQTLLDQYVKQQTIRGTCTLHFDGEALRLDRTPSNYDMEDGDLIDVVR